MKDGRTHLAHSRTCDRFGQRRARGGHPARRGSGRHDDARRDGRRGGRTGGSCAPTTDAPGTLEEIVADKGYHSNATLVDLAAVGIRSYISEPDRGRGPTHQTPKLLSILRGARGGRLRRRRAELAERSFAHLYETGAMRRTHLANILKRLLIHGSGFNLGLAMRLPGHRHAAALTGAARGRHDRLSCPVGTHCSHRGRR